MTELAEHSAWQEVSCHYFNYWVVAWSSGNIVGCDTELGLYRLRIQPSHPRQLSLAIPQWVGKMSTGNGYGHRWEETASSAWQSPV